MTQEVNHQHDADGKEDAAHWKGFAEIDRAIAENRLIAYRWKKAWADPIGRRLGAFVIVCIAGVFGYLIGASLGWWR